MSVLIFIIVLVVLILVHELGHFVAAKLSGMRVDEFGIGYPPRALRIAKVGETEYTLNWIPFGGFVKIYGEDADASGPRSFINKSKLLQAVTLVAGVAMNLILAYILLVTALYIGTPRALTDQEVTHATNLSLAVAAVLPNAPAQVAGLKPGDLIVGATTFGDTWQATNPEGFTTFVSASHGDPLTLQVKRGGEELTLIAAAKTGVVATDPSRYALGVSVAPVGVVPLSFIESITQGARLTWGVIRETFFGLLHFFAGVLTFSADLSQVSGPVGIASAVGAASHEGWGDLLALAALISINLALINLLPVPALDGGRLLFVIIEAITRRPIKPIVAQTVNGVGFALLILLMVVVTFHDVYRILPACGKHSFLQRQGARRQATRSRRTRSSSSALALSTKKWPGCTRISLLVFGF